MNASPVFWIFFKKPIPKSLPVIEQVDMIFQEGIIKDVSHQIVQYYGFKTREDVIGYPLHSVWPPESAQHNHETHKHFQDFVNSGYQVVDTEVSGTIQDGKYKWFLNNFRGIIEDDCLISIIGSQIDISERKAIEEERSRLIKELQTALEEVRTLRGILPICSHCKKIRDDQGYWNSIESYLHENTEAELSHGICLECSKKYYPDMDLYSDNQDQE